MKITKAEDVVELTILLTPYEAKRIMNDFDQTTEPSAPGKILYASLAGIVNKATPPTPKPTLTLAKLDG